MGMRFLFSLLLVIICGTPAYSVDPLKVGVVVDAPFVMKNGATFTGIAVDLWNEVAQGLERPYQFVEVCCADIDKPFETLKRNEVDVLVGALSVSSNRYQMADFTLTTYLDKIIVLAHLDYFHTVLSFLKTFFISIGGILSIFIIIFFIYIHLLWYYERPYAKSIPDNYKQGISHIFWHHIVSGRYSEVPRSFVGKMLILCQRAIFYIILIMLNATLISFLTVSLSRSAHPFQSFSDLQKHKVGAIKDSKPYKAGIEAGLKVIPLNSLEAGVKALEEKKIDGYLASYSDVDFYLKENPNPSLGISNFELKQDPYVFATPRGSPLSREINTQILKLRSKNIPEKICKEYLPSGVKNCQL